MLPNFLVIGAEKAATTWLYNQLKQHSDIYLPETKELNFFNQYDSNLNTNDKYNKMGFKWYEHFFRYYNGERSVGEVSPMYLCDPKAPRRIYYKLPNVKIIVILRNPVERAHSHYWYAYNKKHTTKTFSEVIADEDERFIKRGLYYYQLKKYYELFPKENIKVILYEDIKNNPNEVLKNLSEFLNVTTYFEPTEMSKTINGGTKPKSALLLRVINTLSELLRKNMAGNKIMDYLKSTGITERIKNYNKESFTYEVINDEQRTKLDQYYKKPNDKLRNLLDKNITW